MRLTSHTKVESIRDRYKDMITQKTTTTEVDPMVSSRVGKDTFFNSDFTSDKNSVILLHNLPTMHSFSFVHAPKLQILPISWTFNLMETQTTSVAGAPGLEPGPSVLETDMLAIDTMPLLRTRET